MQTYPHANAPALGQAPRKVSSRMRCDVELSVPKPRLSHLRSSFGVSRGPCSNHRVVLYLKGPLRMPLNGELKQNVRVLLRQGARLVVLDLSGVPKIDAAGVGELVRVFNLTTSEGRVLQVVGATARVRKILERVGLFGVLSEGGSPAVTSLAR